MFADVDGDSPKAHLKENLMISKKKKGVEFDTDLTVEFKRSCCYFYKEEYKNMRS